MGRLAPVHQQKQQAINIAIAAAPPIEIPIMSLSEFSWADLVELLESSKEESSGDDVEEEAGVLKSSKTAAKSIYKSDDSDEVQTPSVHPPNKIDPSGRTATSLASSFDVLPA